MLMSIIYIYICISIIITVIIITIIDIITIFLNNRLLASSSHLNIWSTKKSELDFSNGMEVHGETNPGMTGILSPAFPSQQRRLRFNGWAQVPLPSGGPAGPHHSLLQHGCIPCGGHCPVVPRAVYVATPLQDAHAVARA